MADEHARDNQPPDFAPCDLWTTDLALQEALEREGGGAFASRVACYGALAGSQLQAWAVDAHRDRPRLSTHDRAGRRVDRVDFHPAYHQLMAAAVEHGVAGLSWAERVPGAHVARAALSFLHHQAEPGTSCPLTMTHAAVPALATEPSFGAWIDKVAACRYDPSDVPATSKAGVTFGMGMTERQGGSDVRTNTTRATRMASGDVAGGRDYALEGHKWFFSAPMSDAHLVLAQAAGGLTCFLLPRLLPDGGRNGCRLVRLKEKLGDWSNASAEVEFHGAVAARVGEEGDGIATILGMVMLTRLDCLLGSAAGMRMALARALHHATHRRAFGRVLRDLPLMRHVLADLAIESEAATSLAFRVAGAVDRAGGDPAEAAFARIATAVGKYWVCRRAPGFVNEAQECLGGAGYVEDSVFPLLYRQAPLNSIWEGSGNVQCLDVLRALARSPGTRDVVLAELDGARGGHPALDAASAALRDDLDAAIDEVEARAVVERLALALQATVLLRAGSPLADAFCGARLGRRGGLAYGTMAGTRDFGPILARAWPGGD